MVCFPRTPSAIAFGVGRSHGLNTHGLHKLGSRPLAKFEIVKGRREIQGPSPPKADRNDNESFGKRKHNVCRCVNKIWRLMSLSEKNTGSIAAVGIKYKVPRCARNDIRHLVNGNNTGFLLPPSAGSKFPLGDFSSCQYDCIKIFPLWRVKRHISYISSQTPGSRHYTPVLQTILLHDCRNIGKIGAPEAHLRGNTIVIILATSKNTIP